jgi:hypothetical protein
LYYTKKYPLSLISSSLTDGIITIPPNISSIYKVEIADFHGNKTAITIPIESANQEVKIPKVIKKTN